MDDAETVAYPEERLSKIREPTSPSWIKPLDVLRIRRKLKRQSSTALKTLDQNANLGNVVVSQVHCNGKEKNLNPFRCTNKVSLSESFHPKECTADLKLRNSSSELSSPENDLKKIPSPSPVVPSVVDENAHLGLNEERDHFHYTEDKKKPPHPTWKKHLPVDWSLKTRIRFLSPKSFPWRGSLKTSEEASGTTGFVRCLHADQNGNEECNLDSSHGARFYQQALYWIHPSLSWLKLFPRINSSLLKQGSSISPLPNGSFQEALHSDWCTSICSLYQMVRARQCPFFYLCAPTFTVLFRAAGISGALYMHAVITPASRGLRQALKEEGIEFTMPLNETAESFSDSNCENLPDENSFRSLSCEDLQVPNDMRFQSETKSSLSVSGINDEEEPRTWLESMGLSQEDFPSLHPKRPRLQDIPKQTNNQSQSLVYLEGPETQVLLNFLLNSKMCVSKTGPLAGIPPTLLSPTSFNGATLRSLKVRHGGIVKYQKQDLYAIELSGPILPSTVHGLCSLLNTTQDGNFTGLLATHTSTTPFANVTSSCFSGAPSLFATENLKDCGLPGPLLQLMCSKDVEHKGSLSEIVVEKGLFLWS